MKAAIFGAVLLACAIPASGQVYGTAQPSAPVTSGRCEAALVSPGVPSGVVVLTVPAPLDPSAYRHGPRSRTTPAHRGNASSPSSRPGGVVSGGVPMSGIGAMERSGVGTMTSSGVGRMESSGVGAMTSSGVGSIGMPSPGLAPSPVSPFAAPVPSPTAGASPNANAIHGPGPVTLQRTPFFCP
jgi:hypothetical protein